MKALRIVTFAAAALAAAVCQAGPRTLSGLDHRPDAIIDLATDNGVRLVQGGWRYRSAQLIQVDHRAPGSDLKPSGAPIRTNDITPHAGAADFDDADWERIGANTLDARRGDGRLCFSWYRINVVLPKNVGEFSVRGSTAVFEVVVDDYAEVWVNGALPIALGQSGGGVVKGFNAPNRVVLTRDAQPGQRFQIAVLGANGPQSQPPGNFIWLRSATLDFYGPERARVGMDVATEIVRHDAALDAIVPRDARIEKLAEGFQFIEGPVWIKDGYLLFSDPNDNVIYRWTPDGELSVFRSKSGYAGADIGRYGQPGSNGLTLDPQGRLTIAEHGNRRVTRLEPNGVLTVLTDRYEGKRLNSPNDLVYKSDGTLYFSDPPFGLPKFHDDPARELPYTGVFRYDGRQVQLLTQELQGPNGLAFSPDEHYLYVDNWDVNRKVVMRYPVRGDGMLGEGEVFFDMKGAPGEEALDGLKVDRAGNLYVSGPGGIWIISPQGRRLGMIRGPELAANFAWGDADGKTLYMTARTGLYRIRLNVEGVRP